jgi:hypothetical protein
MHPILMTFLWLEASMTVSVKHRGLRRTQLVSETRGDPIQVSLGQYAISRRCANEPDFHQSFSFGCDHFRPFSVKP